MIKRIVNYLDDARTSEYPLSQSIDSDSLEKINPYKMFTTKVRLDLAEKLEQQAYWEQKNIMEVVELALVAHFEGKSFDQIPENVRSKKRQKKTWSN